MRGINPTKERFRQLLRIITRDNPTVRGQIDADTGLVRFALGWTPKPEKKRRQYGRAQKLK